MEKSTGTLAKLAIIFICNCRWKTNYYKRTGQQHLQSKERFELHVKKHLVFIPDWVSSLNTLRSPSSPPQAMYPCSLFHDIDANFTLLGIAI